MNTLRAIVDHALGEAEELEQSAEQKTTEAQAQRERASAIRKAYEIAARFERPNVKEEA